MSLSALRYIFKIHTCHVLYNLPNSAIVIVIFHQHIPSAAFTIKKMHRCSMIVNYTSAKFNQHLPIRKSLKVYRFPIPDEGLIITN